MLSFLLRPKGSSAGLPTSTLLNEQTFYTSFLRDLRGSRKEVLIESPFITRRRMMELYPVLRKLRRRGVEVTINTREPAEHDWRMYTEALEAVAVLQQIGVQVLYTGGLHRKLAVIDRCILYEGSLNVMSQRDSCEIMRRTVSEQLATELLRFVGAFRFLEGGKLSSWQSNTK